MAGIYLQTPRHPVAYGGALWTPFSELFWASRNLTLGAFLADQIILRMVHGYRIEPRVDTPVIAGRTLKAPAKMLDRLKAIELCPEEDIEFKIVMVQENSMVHKPKVD